MIEKKHKSFTLIELLVVISVMALLSSIVLVSMKNVRANSRDARRLSDLDQLRKAMEFYYDKYGNYPQITGPLSVNGKDDALTAILKNEGILPIGITDPEINSGCVYYYGAPSWWLYGGKTKPYQIEIRFKTQSGAAKGEGAGGDCWPYNGEYNWGSGVCAGYNCSFFAP